MGDETNVLFKALDGAGGDRDFVRALADLVSEGTIVLDPDVEYGIRDTPESPEYVNITWAFAVPHAWLTAWIEGVPARTAHRT